MLYFLVTFIALTTIKNWNPLFIPQDVIHPSADSCPSTYPHHHYHNTATCTMYNSFPNLNLSLDNNLMGSISHLYDIATGPKTHNTGCMTHNTAGRVTLHTFELSIQSDYSLMPGYMTSYPINVSSKWHLNVTINVLRHKHHSKSKFDQKPHKHYKRPALPLFLAINHSIYYLLNGTFNQAYDVNHLIN